MNTAVCVFCGTELQDNLVVCPSCGMAQAAPARTLPMGTELQGGKFAIGRLLGEGGFGITYKGAHKPLQRTVALKELFPEGAVRNGTRVLVPEDRQDDFLQERESILHEARLIARLSSPHIVKVHDMFLENDTAYIVMEYLEGQTLQERIDFSGQLPLAEVQKVALDTCEALAEIHSYQLLHRDIKPANIVLTEDLRTVLIDFGSAREFVVRQTRQHTRILTEDYAAPEQYSDQARFGPYTDIFCLGATLFHALAGTPPPGALKRLLNTNLTVDFPPGFHGPLCSAIQQALHLNVLDRPQNIEALRNTILGSRETSASAPPASSTSQTVTLPSVDDGLIQKETENVGRLTPRGLVLVTLFVVLISAVSATAASGVVPFRSIASTLVSASPLPTSILALVPAATLQSISVVPARFPTLTPTLVAPKPTATATLRRTPTPTRVPLHAHTNAGANLRSGPGVVYDVVGVLAENTTVQPVSQTTDWLWLKLDAGVWIYAALVDDIPRGLPLETLLPAPPLPTATPVPTNQSVPVRGDWSLPILKNEFFLMQDGLEIKIQEVIYEDSSRMQSYIERRGGQSCAGCLAVKLMIINRKGNKKEYLVYEDFKLLKGDPDAEPYPQVKCDHPNALRSMENPGSLRGLARNMGGDERIVCFEGVAELALDVKLAYAPVFLYEEENAPTPTPTPEGSSVVYATEPVEGEQEYRTGWSAFFILLGV